MEFGTANLIGIASLWAGQDWLEQHGLENIHAREMRMAREMIEGFRKIEGVRLYCCDSLENHTATFSINIDGLDAGDVGERLDMKHNIATRTGLHCAPLVHQQLGTASTHGSVRFSIGAFNTEKQIDLAIQAMAETAKWAAERKHKKSTG
jgi:selenocysteine lyase/cysteine desulfurase